uniref:Uncharacterized protein n=1 Tax=Anopheles atroparvus TaxID=41427 RepID=A0AAG5D226_ANOAO
MRRKKLKKSRILVYFWAIYFLQLINDAALNKSSLAKQSRSMKRETTLMLTTARTHTSKKRDCEKAKKNKEYAPSATVKPCRGKVFQCAFIFVSDVLSSGLLPFGVGRSSVGFTEGGSIDDTFFRRFLTLPKARGSRFR